MIKTFKQSWKDIVVRTVIFVMFPTMLVIAIVFFSNTYKSDIGSKLDQQILNAKNIESILNMINEEDLRYRRENVIASEYYRNEITQIRNNLQQISKAMDESKELSEELLKTANKNNQRIDQKIKDNNEKIYNDNDPISVRKSRITDRYK